MPEFLGLPCVELKNEAISLLVTQTVGPRILSLRFHGGENLFAEVPDFTLDCPGVGKCHLRGGHRLWLAPESAARTYLPDDRPVQVEAIARGVRVTQPVDELTGIQKSLHIQLAEKDARVLVSHALTNRGAKPEICAPWAITQFKLGGIAFLPHKFDGEGLQANRSFALWPYTDIRSPHISWGKLATLIRADLRSGALKVGFPNPLGWLGYFVNRTLFVKQALFDPLATYCDFGSSSQCYCNDRFLELETLGPLRELAPGATVVHEEVWRVFEPPPIFLPTEAEHVSAISAQFGSVPTEEEYVCAISAMLGLEIYDDRP